jgi:hypothetical protein
MPVPSKQSADPPQKDSTLAKHLKKLSVAERLRMNDSAVNLALSLRESVAKSVAR